MSAEMLLESVNAVLNFGTALILAWVYTEQRASARERNRRKKKEDDADAESDGLV